MKVRLRFDYDTHKVYFVDGQTFVIFKDGEVWNNKSRPIGPFVTIEAFVRHWRTA